MNSHELFKALHAAATINADAEVKAAERTRDLYLEQGVSLERSLAGACMVAGFANWTISTSLTAFAASWHVSGAHSALEVNLTIPVVASWSALAPLFVMLDEYGGVDADAWSNSDMAESYSRVYSNLVYKKDGAEEWGQVHVRITAALPGDTDTCKRIVVGYTSDAPITPTAQPIYELKCEE